MECKSCAENGRRVEPAVRAVRAGWVRGQHEHGAGGARPLLQLDVAAAVRSAPAGLPVHGAMVPAHQNHDADRAATTDTPFMNNMDEISYWIYSKRAPCLMTYDNVKKQNEQAQCSKPKPKSVPSVVEVPSPKKKKKRKLSLLEDDSDSVVEQQNVYFDTSQKQKPPLLSSCKSDTMGSDIDFNIKNTSVQGKQKRTRLQKSNRTTLHKKNKVVTSTPKASNLRRSLRQAQQSLNNNSQLNNSFEILNNGVTNGNHKQSTNNQKTPEKLKKTPELLAGGDQRVEVKKNSSVKLNKSKNDVLNGQFEDLSDVSGFTANYIRSTKLQSTKTPRKLRCKNTRNLVKESQQTSQKDDTMVVCVNKAVNTGMSNLALNCSTESENVINLVTKSADRSTKVSKSTSLLKFMEPKANKVKDTETPNDSKVERSRTRARANLNVSFQSQSSTSRYPKRYRNNTTQDTIEETTEDTNQDKKRKISKNSSDFNSSDRKENPEATTISRTRSGRNIGLTLRQPENSVLVLSNSTEQVSSMVSMNVASPVPDKRERVKKKKRITRRTKKPTETVTRLQRDSLRDKSGFAACFSDSDDDSEPLRQRKFFCA
ncbi:unnamed protein product [Chrysodeixis includens]|uniref:Uncharacterized protein n=1 Tax=Chrysodeixis includens TaxID=689277 RepID=A0A9P0BKM1_CHRIL|nr:unnamed protein product [Chrysodeixis includens]